MGTEDLQGVQPGAGKKRSARAVGKLLETERAQAEGNRPWGLPTQMESLPFGRPFPQVKNPIGHVKER